MQPHLLLIDDDRELCEILTGVFARNDMQCDACHDGESGLRRALTQSYDLVVLDVMLPRRAGLDVLRQLRQKRDVPVLMLSARGDDFDRVLGLEVGADDYLPKPFVSAELVARIRAILRRTASRRPENEVLDACGIELDPMSRRVRADQKPVDITSLEYELLRLLLENAGRTVTRDDFARRIHQREASVHERSLDTHVANLRRKLGAERIQTVRGIGYLIPARLPGTPAS